MDDNMNKVIFYRHSFIENKRVAEGNKAKWNTQVDTILQRGDQYIPKPKATQRSTLNYFERIKEKEKAVRVQEANHTCANVFRESQYSDKQRKKRTFENDYKNKTTVPKKDKQIRVYPELIKSNDKIKGLLCAEEKGINPYEKYPLHFRAKASVTQPSEELIKMNTRKQFLPCEQGRHTSHGVKRGYTNTHSRLFNIEDSKDNAHQSNGCNNPSFPNERSNSTPKIKYIHRIELKDKTDHIHNLINYRYGPKFKDDVITDKPNRSSFKNIVTKTAETFKEDYIAQVY